MSSREPMQAAARSLGRHTSAAAPLPEIGNRVIVAAQRKSLSQCERNLCGCATSAVQCRAGATRCFALRGVAADGAAALRINLTPENGLGMALPQGRKSQQVCCQFP